MGPPLPIDEALPRLRTVLAEGASAVLVAPPGAGKTTRVPLALLGEEWLDPEQRIVMLEPRRLAARAAAAQMARLLGERLGETVGYRIRLDTRVGPSTRIEVVTEGVLTRMLQSDPGLDGVGAVILDEFHERSLTADLGLALTLHARTLLRPELRVVVMSATIDPEPVQRMLGGAPVVAARGAPSRSTLGTGRCGDSARPPPGRSPPRWCGRWMRSCTRRKAMCSSSSPARGRSGGWRRGWRGVTSGSAWR